MSKKRDSVKEEIYDRFGVNPKTLTNSDSIRTNTYRRMYQRIIGELSMNRFKWSGLPDSVDERFLELCLFFQALSVAFVDDKTGRLMALKAQPTGRKNIVDNPIQFTVYSPYDSFLVEAKDCVPIWANYFRIPDWDVVEAYSTRLAEIDRTIEINSMNARRTKILTYDENTRLSAQNINSQIEKGAASIPVNFAMGDMIKSLDLGIDPDSIEKLSILRSRLWSECMGLLGINNANQDKKERLVEAEVSSNDDQVENMRRVNLNSRQAAAQQITKKFADVLDGEVTVEFHTELQPDEPEPMGGNDADIH